MKFDRQFRRIQRPVSQRRLDGRRLGPAARRALRREADEVALFPELQPTETPEQRIARLDAAADAHFQRMRDHTAQTWCQARCAFRNLTSTQRAQVLARWHSNWAPPHEAHYLADIIHTVRRSAPDGGDPLRRGRGLGEVDSIALNSQPSTLS